MISFNFETDSSDRRCTISSHSWRLQPTPCRLFNGRRRRTGLASVVSTKTVASLMMTASMRAWRRWVFVAALTRHSLNVIGRQQQKKATPVGRRQFPKSGSFRKMMNSSENILMRALLQRIRLRPREDTDLPVQPAALEDAPSPAHLMQLWVRPLEDTAVPAAPAQPEQSAAREDTAVPARPAFDANHFVKPFGGKKSSAE